MICLSLTSSAQAQQSVTCYFTAAIPQYYSGTNCKAYGVGVNFRQMPLNSVKITLKGTVSGQIEQTVVTSLIAQPPAQLSWWSPVGTIFDSSHFDDGTQLTITIDVADTMGNHASASGNSTIYNKAFVYGNQNPYALVYDDPLYFSPIYGSQGIGSLNYGASASGRVISAIPQPQYTVTPSNSFADPAHLTVRKTAILAAIPSQTVFYAFTHGDVNTFGDAGAYITPVGDPRTGPDYYISINDLWQPIQTKINSGLPGYNFIFFDSCTTSISDIFANALGVKQNGNDVTDQCSIGFQSNVDDSLHNAQWTGHVWTYLMAGYTIDLAWQTASFNFGSPTEGASIYQNGSPVAAKIWGDHAFKYHGVYGSTDMTSPWYR